MGPHPSHEAGSTPPDACEIISVGKRRDGGTRFWCLRHHADATAKYGVSASQCRYAHIPLIKESEIHTIRVSDYAGGVGLWGAVPPVYDTTTAPLDRGIHVHARRDPRGPKVIDATYRAVRVEFEGEAHLVTDLDAIYFMVSRIFEQPLREVRCTRCQHSHLDRDWFAVHPHRRHLCAGCGHHFRGDAAAVGNPIGALQRAFPSRSRAPSKAKPLSLRQADYPGGIQIWGSNRAFLWTSPVQEATGVHIHAFAAVHDAEPVIDETYSEVEIDGIKLVAAQVGVLMAQRSMPHLNGRVANVSCSLCAAPEFATDRAAYELTVQRTCRSCGEEFSARGVLRKVVSNPAVECLARLANYAPGAPRVHDIGLIPETL